MLPPHGDPASPIWLLGDSAPPVTEGVRYALDPRHPTRHNIWTSVLDVIQERLFSASSQQPRRLSRQALYISNAVDTSGCKASDERVSACLENFRRRFSAHMPRTVLTFGSYAYQFAVAATEKPPLRPKALQKTLKLEDMRKAFDERVHDDQSVVVPLLHQIVAMQFAKCHEAYQAEGFDSYYEYCGVHLATRLLRVHVRDRVWV